MNLNKNILRFYISKSQKKKEFDRCSDYCCEMLVYPNNISDKFHFQYEVSVLDFIEVRLVKNSDLSIINADIELNKFTANGKNYIAFNLPMYGIEKGIYHFEVWVNNEPSLVQLLLISEDFKLCPLKKDKSDLLIKWKSSCNVVGNVVFPEGYEERLYLNAKQVTGESELEEEFIENTNGVEVVKSQVLKQNYYFEIWVSTYLAEALTALPLYDEVKINGMKAEKILVVPTNDEKGCKSMVKISYEFNRIIKNGCCDNGDFKQRLSNYNKTHYSQESYNTLN